MILEVAILAVIPGQEFAFQAAFTEASSMISSMQGYQQWKKLLHHFYDPFPTVEHYALVFQHQK